MAQPFNRHVADFGEAGENLRSRNRTNVRIPHRLELLADAEERDESGSAQEAAERARRRRVDRGE
jgi:hypothetical protein